MYEQKHTLTFVMAGGKGTRLGPLTANDAKPNLSFGGKYRLIDFVMSNLYNSELRKAYVLTQYQARGINEHVNKFWRNMTGREGMYVTESPQETLKGREWFEGTADAISIDLIKKEDPRHVAIFGADHVYMIYRRGREEMPARVEEVHHAEQEGVDFNFLTNPISYFGNEKGYVCEIECQRMELCEPDASGRRRPVACAGSNFKLKIDQVIVSVGTTPNPIIAKTTPGLETQKKGEILVNEVGMTSIPGVFAGGDIVTGAATVITAMGAGRLAAAAMHEYLTNL